MTGWLDPVRAALDAADEPVRVFFRDDDGGWEDARLFALLDVFAVHDQPVDVAVIPIAVTAGLARALRTRAVEERVELHQHGCAHVNHEVVGRSSEFGPARDLPHQLEDIEHGCRLLEERLGGLLRPVFTPPWNRCCDVTGKALVALGFKVLSRDARSPRLELPGLLEMPVDVGWTPADGDDGARAVGEQLGDALAHGGTVGVMFHHAHLQAADLRHIGELLELLGAHPKAATCHLWDAAQSLAPAPWRS